MSDSEYTEEEEEEFRDDMRVFLRLRPINKLEQSRRSKNCIELHEDPTLVTVDSPLEGEYDYTFDHVFEEFATQEEVYEQAIAEVPHSLMEGYNCTVIAYGQTGTGKTHSMVGVNGGSDGLLYKSTKMMGKSMGSVGDFDDTATRDAGNLRAKLGESASNLSATIIEGVDPEAEGMIPRTIASIFAIMKRASATTEFTIRVSYVEIYLEKVLDLLNPVGTTSITIEEEVQADKAAGPTATPAGVRIKGASELCCLDEADVCALLTRGNACRTMSSTEMNTESSRSHAIFVLRLEQTDRLTSTTKSSVLHMVDLAGSELASKEAANKRKSTVASISAVQTEALMINKSLNALNKMIRAQLAHQQGEQDVPLDSISRQSKLTRLLRPSFGGNCLTTLLLTASPSSYNIGETISTINFGQRCRRIYNDPNIVETEPAHVYRQQLREFKSNYEDAMGLARALASECLRMRDGESTGKGPLWDTIAHLGRKENPPFDFKMTIKQKKLNLDDSESDEEEEIAYFSNEKVKMEDEIEGLKEENEYLTRQRQDVDGHLAELQSEVAVLRTQNENLTVEKQRNVEELVHAKNEVQSLSQRKLEVEHNLRTSQFRENEVIVFLRQFRRFYRNVLKDKAAHGAGSIKAITAEVTDKVPNAPNLNDLRDIDSLLVESGILEDYEMGEDKGSGSYIPSRDALMRSAAAAQRAATSEAEFMKEGPADSSDDDDDQYVAQSITRVPGPLRLPGPGVQMDTITELNTSETKQDESSDESDAGSDEGQRAGADAGAGTTPLDDRSFLSSDTGSMAHSISRVLATGLTVTRRQRLLNTPSGRLTISREKDLEKELHEISERCIDLQMALNEEKAVVDALTNKAGGLSKKRLAQEAITLRQELEKKVASLTAIAWKMNELNLINKTNNEKMASREQHLAYLEMQLDGLQNNNRDLIVARVESEKKLRDEIESYRSIVGGMTVPLWQFGEKNILDKPLATRVVVTAVGGDPSSEFEFDPFKRRKSVGAKEPEIEFPDIPDIPLYDDSVDTDDVSMDRDEILVDEEMPEPPKRPKRRTSDKLRMSVNKLRTARMLMRSMEKSGENLNHVDEGMEAAIAMVASQASSENDQDKPVLTGRSIEIQAPVPPLQPISVQTCNVETQTGEVQIFELEEAVTLDRDKPETYEADVQTEDVQIFDIDIPMIEDHEKELNDADVQTDDVQVFDIDVPMVEDYEKELFDADVQTDEVQVFDIDTPMIADDKEMYDADVQTDEVQVFDIGTAMAPAREDAETHEFGIQTDEEPLKQVFERNLQTDDVQFLIEVDRDDACVQTDQVILDDASAQTDDIVLESSFVQTDDVDTNGIGTMTDRQPEDPSISKSRALGTTITSEKRDIDETSLGQESNSEEEQDFDSEDEASSDEERMASISRSQALGTTAAMVAAGGVAAYAVSEIKEEAAEETSLGEESEYEDDSENEASSAHESEPEVLRSQLLGATVPTLSENSEEETDDASSGQESKSEDEEEFNSEDERSSNGEIEQENEQNAYSSPEERSEEETGSQRDDDTDDEYGSPIKPLESRAELLDVKTAYEKEHEERARRDDSESEEDSYSSENESNMEIAAAKELAGAREEEGSNHSSEGGSTESSQNEQDTDRADEREHESPDGQYGDHEDTFEGDESVQSEGHDFDRAEERDNESPGGRYGDLEDTFEGDASAQSDTDHVDDTFEGDESAQSGDEDSEIEPQVETPKVDVKAEPKESPEDRSPHLARSQSDASPRSRDLSPVNRFMPEEQTARLASNRFMPAEEGLSSSRRAASRRFLVVDDKEPTKNDNLRLSPAASSRRITAVPLLEDDKLLLDVANDNDLGYDDLGTRWGMTDDEIAADAAVLNTPRRENDTLLGSEDDDMQEEVKAAELAAAQVTDEADDVLEDDSSEDGLERDLFDNDFDLKRSLHSTSVHSASTGNRGLQEQFDDQSDHDEPTDDGISKLSHDSFTGDEDEGEEEEEVHDDDFEKMMTEAAAALAAADELMGADATEGVSEHEDTDYNESDVDLSSDDDEEYVSEDGDSDDGDELEYRSAQDKRFSVKEDEPQVQDTERNTRSTDPDPSKLFEGGKTQDYVLREFTDKSVMGKIKPAVTKGGSSRKVDQPVDDDGSIVSTATNKNREAPQKSPLRASAAADESIEPPESTHSAGSSLMERNSSSSRKRDGEGKSDRKRSSRRTDGDRQHRSHRSSRREPDAAGGEAKDRDRRSRRSVDEDGEPKERRSRRSVDGDGEAKEKSRRSRRSVDGDGEAKERERRSRREVDEGGEESKDRRSRRKDDEGGGDRRHRSSRKEGEHRSSTRHKSSRHLGEGGGSSTRHKSSRRLDSGGGDERRHKSSRRLHSSNGDIEEEEGGEKRHRSSRRHRSEDDENGEGGERSKRRSRDDDKARKSKKSSSSRHRSSSRQD